MVHVTIRHERSRKGLNQLSWSKLYLTNRVDLNQTFCLEIVYIRSLQRFSVEELPLFLSTLFLFHVSF